jgi:hypothetical protein
MLSKHAEQTALYLLRSSHEQISRPETGLSYLLIPQ